MSIRSNQMSPTLVFPGIYEAPSVRFSTSNQILQIRSNQVIPVGDLETQLSDLIDVASDQNADVTALQTQVNTLSNEANEEYNNEILALNNVPVLQSQLDQISVLIQNSEQDNFQPYFASYLPNQVYKGSGNVNDTLPDSPQVYSFTPSEGNDGVFNNYPLILFSLTLPTYTNTVYYQFTIALTLLANNVAQTSFTNSPFYNSLKACSNGGIVYFTFINPFTNAVIYSSQTGSVGTVKTPSTIQGGACVSYFTDIVGIPANTPNLYLSFFVSTHYSMNLSNFAYNQAQFFVSDKGWTQGTGYGGALPVLTMLKL